MNDRCEASAAASDNHHVRYETFGHVCAELPDHDGPVHRCRCGFTWGVASQTSFGSTATHVHYHFHGGDRHAHAHEHVDGRDRPHEHSNLTYLPAHT